MSREYTAVPHEYLEEMDCLSDAEYGRLIRGLQMYSITGEEPKFCGQEKVYWKRVRNRENRYQESFGEQEKAKTERAKNAANARWSNAKNANACTSIPSNAKNANTNTNTKTKSNTNTNKNTLASISEDFEVFWAAYPRKVGKKDAQRAFAKAVMPLSILLDALEKQKRSQQWTKDNGQYIPYPATWLNGRRWEDETQSETIAKDSGRTLDADEMAAVQRMMDGDGNA